MKTLALAVALLVACLLAVGWLLPGGKEKEPPPETPAAATAPAFRMRLATPRAGRALFGLLPGWVEDRLDGAAPRELVLDHLSPGAAIVFAGPGRLVVRNDAGWDVELEWDAEGRLAPSSRITFPVYLAERHVRLRCRPAEPPVGHFATRAADGKLSGRFRLEVGQCRNADSNQHVSWPPFPFQVDGGFAGLPPIGQPPAIAPLP